MDENREEISTRDMIDSTKTEADKLLLMVKKYCHDEIRKVVEEGQRKVVKQKTMKSAQEEGYYQGYYEALKNVHFVISNIQKGYIQ